MSPIVTVQAGEIIWPDPRNVIPPLIELFYFLGFVRAQATYIYTHTHTYIYTPTNTYIYTYIYILYIN